MKDKMIYIKYKKMLDSKKKDYMLEQNKLSIEYNINSIKNEIIKGMCDKNER